jgi:hypothetical protein
MSCSPRPGGNGTLDDEKSPGAADMIIPKYIDETSVDLLAEIVSAEQAPFMVRIKAVEISLNLGWGQPVQIIEKSAEAEEIEGDL